MQDSNPSASGHHSWVFGCPVMGHRLAVCSGMAVQEAHSRLVTSGCRG